jgi:acetolactate synthase-1/2/3 large subunit
VTHAASAAVFEPRGTAAEGAGQILTTAARSGVERLWFVSGSELTSLQEGSARSVALGEPTPRLMTCTHEHVALSAALGEVMVSGRPSMTAGHADLGLLHQGGAIHNAMWGSAPVLMLSGYPPTQRDARDHPVFWKQQRWDPGEIVRQYVKWDYRLSAGDDVGTVTARALQVALSPRPGPVYLAMPAEVGRLPARPSRVTSAQDLGIPRLGAGDAGVVDEIAGRLLRAERPLIVTDRVGDSAAAVEHLDALASDFGVRVLATRYRMNLRDNHPCAAPRASVADADVVLVIEHPVPWVPAEHEPSDEAWVAVVGTDPVESQIPLYEFRAAARTVAEPAAFLESLRATLERLAGPGDRERADRRREEIARARRPRTPAVAGAAGLPTSDLAVEALGTLLSPEDLVTWEVVGTAKLPRTVPGTLFEKGGSSLGWSVAAAVGARLASGDRPTVALAGDGSYLFGSPDSCLWLQQEYDAPVLTVVINNGGYRTGTATLAHHYPDGYAVGQPEIAGGHLSRTPDFAAHARSQGAHGEAVERATDLESVLSRARLAVERDRVPAVIEVRVPQHLRHKAAGRAGRQSSSVHPAPAGGSP